MAYARRRSTRRSTSSSRYRPAARRSYTATRRKRAPARKRASSARQQVVKLVIEHTGMSEVQRPLGLMANADRADKNKKKTF